MIKVLLIFNILICFVATTYTTITKDNVDNRDLDEIGKYEPTWESLDTRPLPQWYDDAKVGIFIHWGVYSVPSFGSEWFWMNWRGYKYDNYVDFMEKNYKPGFTYQDFAKDFTAELFDPVEWSKIFDKSGAKYVVLTSKHHEGFTMWPSKYSFSWNSVDLGPHRDIVGELASAIRTNTKLKFGVYHSLYEWFNPLYLDDKFHLFMKNEFVEYKVWPSLFELVNKYKPEVIWSDGEWEAPAVYWKSKEFLTWLYNESPVKDTVVTNDRWGMTTLCKHGDFYTCTDRFNPGVLQKHKWENAMTIDKKSWGHRSDAKIEDYLSSKELIKELVTTVSCGGNLLVNVGPSVSGIIEPIFVERLTDMGNWLNANGQGIYNTRPWIYQNDTKTASVWYTKSAEPVNGRDFVYAIILDYPYATNGVNLYSLGGKYDAQTKVQLLGYNRNNLKWYGSNDSVYIVFPEKKEIDQFGLTLAWTLKIELPTLKVKSN